MYIILMVFKNFKEFVHGKKPTVLFFCFEQYIVEPYEIAIVVGGTWPDVGKCHKFSIMYMYLFGYINWWHLLRLILRFSFLEIIQDGEKMINTHDVSLKRKTN